MKKRILCILLSALLVLSLLPVSAGATTSKDSRLPDVTIQTLKAKFPAGKYWNHAEGEANNPDGYTDTPCDHHGSCGSLYDGSCGCNSFDRAIQCMGFAYKLAYDTFGSSARKWEEVSARDYEDDVKAGDIARISVSGSAHSIFILSVSGDTITYADANYDQGCGIRWDATISREKFNSRLIYVKKSPEITAPEMPELQCNSPFMQYDTVCTTWTPMLHVDYYDVTILYNDEYLNNFQTTATSHTFVAECAGVYSILVTAVNPAGSSATTRWDIGVTAHDCPSHAFADVPNYSDWSHEGIDYVLSAGLFNGVSATEFEPEEPMTRGMIATVLWRNAGAPQLMLENPFVDVAENFWYTQAIVWANANGIMNGVGGGAFEPDELLTREQIVTVLYRYAYYKGVALTGSASLDGFADSSLIDSWALDAVRWAVSNGVIQGSAEETGLYLAPLAGATRAQVATILMRFSRDVMQ